MNTTDKQTPPELVFPPQAAFSWTLRAAHARRLKASAVPARKQTKSIFKRLLPVVAAAALVAPASAVAGKPEAKQFATYLSGVLPQQPGPAVSGRAEAKQAAAYLSGMVGVRPSRPTPAQSGRAEAKAFAGSLEVGMMEPRSIPSGGDGFDWGDAAIGSGATAGLLLLLAALGRGIAISRRHVPIT